MSQPSVRRLDVTEIDPDEWRAGSFLIERDFATEFLDRRSGSSLRVVYCLRFCVAQQRRPHDDGLVKTRRGQPLPVRDERQSVDRWLLAVIG
jgi:hypothetical protein